MIKMIFSVSVTGILEKKPVEQNINDNDDFFSQTQA